MWSALSAVAYKELLHLRRDRNRLPRILTLQVLQFFALAFLDTTARDLPAVVVDQDRSTDSREFIARVAESRTVTIRYYTSSVEQAREHIRAGRASVGLVVPPEYSRMRAAGRAGRLLMLLDGADATAASQATSSITGVASRLNLEAQQQVVETSSTVTPHTILLFNPQGRTPVFLLPGLLGIVLSSAYSLNSMRRLVEEREGGHLERLLMTPASSSALVLGKLVPWFLFGMFNAAAFLLVAHLGFGVPVRGSLGLLVYALAMYVATALSIGSVIGAGKTNRRAANNFLVVFAVGALLLSGYIFPLSSLPKWLLPIAYAIPQTHFIEVVRGICLRAATATELAPELLYLTLVPVALSAIAALRFSRSTRI